MGTGYNKKWDIDLADGEYSEDVIKSFFDKRVKIEVKRDDKRPLETKHIFVEVEYKGDPSGITTTEAEYWAHSWRPGCFVLMPTDDLKKLVDRALRTGKRVNGGDKLASQGALVPLDWILWEPFYE